MLDELKRKRRRKLLKRVVLSYSQTIRKLAVDLGMDRLSRDYLLRRIESEGPSFATKVLPTFSKLAITACNDGEIRKDLRKSFSSFRWAGGSPLLFRGWLLSAVSGDSTSLYKIRQVSDYFYKLSYSFSDEEIRTSEKKYVEVNHCMKNVSLDDKYVQEARKVFFRTFKGLSSLTPIDMFKIGATRDGPGAFAGSTDIKQRYGISFEEWKKYPNSIRGSHRKDMQAFSGFFKEHPVSLNKIVWGDPGEKPVCEDRVCELRFVPKDSRGPRVISKEPYFLLKAQFAFMDTMVHQLEKYSRKHINFLDQTVNQRVCRGASIDGSFATIDLKDASNRVSLKLIRKLFEKVPIFDFAVRHLRSTHVKMPSGDIQRLSIFANMGSGLCFPTLALVVFLFAVVGVKRRLGCTVEEAINMVYVYGDDLICPSECYHEVKTSLEAAGLIVNNDKSFYRGFFRESCGADYHGGISVSPVRLKLQSSGLDPISNYRNGFIPITTDGGILQLERHCRELVSSGLTSLAAYYYRKLEEVLGPLPFVAFESNALGRYDPSVLPKDVSAECWVPSQAKAFTKRACPYKRLGRDLRSDAEGFKQDFRLTPLRRKVILKRKVLCGAEIYCWGIPDNSVE